MVYMNHEDTKNDVGNGFEMKVFKGIIISCFDLFILCPRWFTFKKCECSK